MYKQLDVDKVQSVTSEALFAGGRYHHQRGGLRGTPTPYRLTIKETTYRVYFKNKVYFILRQGELQQVSLEWLQSQIESQLENV